MCVASLSSRQNLSPQPPDESEIENQRQPMRPGDPAIVKRQELNLHQKQEQHGRDDQRRPSDRPEQPAERPAAQVARAGEKLDEDVARQSPLQGLALRGGDVARRVVQRLMEPFRLLGQKDEMDERIGVDDEEQDRREEEEGDERKLDVGKERQLD